jgi:hypothetical protein
MRNLIRRPRQRHDFGAPANNQSAPKGDDGRRNVPDAEDRGIYAIYGHYIGGARLADAVIPMEGLPITAANPANWANVTRLADGTLKLSSGQIIAAATLLEAMDAHAERAAVSAAISRFELDSTGAAVVLAARAYVWAKSYAPLNYAVPWSEPRLESVSQSITALELARPGALYLALQGDEPSARYISVAVEDGMQRAAISESRARPAKLPAALRTSISRARAALDRMRPHHLIPPNVWEEKLDLATLASQVGWRADSIENLIALPADEANQARVAAENGLVLPIHSWSHSDYDWTPQRNRP